MVEVQITTGGQERVQAATDLLSEAFRTDPTITYLLSSLNPEQRATYRPVFFHAILTAAAANNATFDETGDWKSCGVRVPPGSAVDRLGPSLYPTFLSVAWSIGLGGCQASACHIPLVAIPADTFPFSQRMFWEMAPLTKACKAKALRRDEKYYYVFFLGTREDGRGRGLCSAMVKHYQAMAATEQVAIYMEAATEYSWRLYEGLGFVTVDEIVLGKGKAAADGTACAGGPGLTIWGMIWRPEKLT